MTLRNACEKHNEIWKIFWRKWGVMEKAECGVEPAL